MSFIANLYPPHLKPTDRDTCKREPSLHPGLAPPKTIVISLKK